MECQRLDPCNDSNSLGQKWNVMLKMTGVKIELILDTDMSQFIEKGMGGGISYIPQRYSKANNESMKSYGRVQLSEVKIAEDHSHMHR